MFIGENVLCTIHKREIKKKLYQYLSMETLIINLEVFSIGIPDSI